MSTPAGDPRILRLSAEIAEIKRRLASRSGSQLAYSSIEDGAIREFDLEGTLTQIIGRQFDGTHMAAPLVGPTPPTPVAAYLTPTAGGLNIRWTGNFLENAIVPMDFSRVEIVIATDDVFDPGNPPMATFETPRGGEVFVKLPPSTHYVWLVARALTGKASEPSPVSSAVPALIEEWDIQDFALTVKKVRSNTHQFY